MECQQNRVNIPPLRAPLSRQPLGHGSTLNLLMGRDIGCLVSFGHEQG